MLEVQSPKSDVLLDKLVIIWKEQEIDPQKTRFCCLQETNLMLWEKSTPHWPVFLAGRTNKLLLGLWKSIHYSSLNHLILTEIQKAYGIKVLHLVKVVVTRWPSHGGACKRCLERYRDILEAVGQSLVATPNPEISEYWSNLSELSRILQILLLDDILTIISKSCLLLQSDHKDFRATHDVVEQTLITLKKCLKIKTILGAKDCTNLQL